MNPYLVKDLLHYCNISVKACTSIERHTIRYYDLTFVLKGSMTYLINGKKHVLSDNDLMFLVPGTLRERLQGDCPVPYVSFNFSALSETYLPAKSFVRRAVTHEKRRLSGVFPQSHISPMHHERERVTAILNYILFLLLDEQKQEIGNPHVLKMLRYIELHISSPVSLRELSEHVYLSKEYTAHIFKKETGKTVTEYVNYRKMLLAKEMLEGGEMSLSEIAESLGYESYSYFFRVYKKTFGVSPKKAKRIFEIEES